LSQCLASRRTFAASVALDSTAVTSRLHTNTIPMEGGKHGPAFALARFAQCKEAEFIDSRDGNAEKKNSAGVTSMYEQFIM